MPSSITKIQTISVGSGGSSSIAFNNIPQTYTDLIIKFSGRPSNATTTAMVWVYNSSVTVANAYNNLRLYGTDNSVSTDTFGVDYSLNNMMTRGDSTSNTFGNGEIYIPNYTRNGFGKIASSDGTGVGDNSFRMLNINYWIGTDPITSITLLPFGSIGTFVQHTVATLYGVTKYAEASNGSKASGGTVTTAGGYTYHTFFSSGMFTPSTNITGAEVLVVAGGGSGGHDQGGGGGAGGYRTSTGLSLTSGTGYQAIVGAGGSGNTSFTQKCNGTNSVFSTVLSTGGGGAGGYNQNGNAGGSGGGGGGANTGTGGTGGAGNAGSFSPVEGYAGGTSPNSQYSASGGGGATEVGQNAPGSIAGKGGNGSNVHSSWLSATNTGVNGYLAGGGGGGIYSPGGATGGAGGFGGAGFGGGTIGTVNGTPALPNTGSGGGGGSGNGGAGGAGGSGIVIIRYTT